MGLTLEFYVGNIDVLSRAFERGEVNFDLLSVFSQAGNCADLSLHLEIQDLEILSEKAAKMAQNPPIYLRDSIEQIIADETDYGAILISQSWVEQFFAIPIWASQDLTARWFRTMGQNHGTTLEVNSAAEKAIESLIRICKQATKNSESIVLFWLGSSLF